MLEKATWEEALSLWERWGPLKSPQTAPPSPQDPEELVSPGPTNRKPKTAVPQVGIESFSGDTRLHHHREIFCIQLRDLVHMGQVDAHSTLVAGKTRKAAQLGL